MTGANDTPLGTASRNSPVATPTRFPVQEQVSEPDARKIDAALEAAAGLEAVAGLGAVAGNPAVTPAVTPAVKEKEKEKKEKKEKKDKKRKSIAGDAEKVCHLTVHLQPNSGGESLL